jgi:hypothetical protein
LGTESDPSNEGRQTEEGLLVVVGRQCNVFTANLATLFRGFYITAHHYLMTLTSYALTSPDTEICSRASREKDKKTKEIT